MRRAQSFEAIHGLLIDVRNVRDGPAQIRDRRHRVHLFKRRGSQLILGQRKAVLLESPAIFGDQLQCRLRNWPAASLFRTAATPWRTRRFRRCAACRRQTIERIAEDVRVNIGTSGWVSMLRKNISQPRRHFLLVVQRQECIVHAERIGAGQPVENERNLECQGAQESTNAPMSTSVVTPTLAE